MSGRIQQFIISFLWHPCHGIRYSNSYIQQLHRSLTICLSIRSISIRVSDLQYLQFCNNLWCTDCWKSFLYKILNEHVAVPMNQLDLVLGDIRLRGSTTKQRLKIPRCASTQFQKSFAARTITEWNSLTDSITSLASVSSFQKPSVCYIMTVGVHTPLPKYPSGNWQLLSRSRVGTRRLVPLGRVGRASWHWAKGVTKHRTSPKYSDILHWIRSKSNKMQVRNAWKP